MQRSATNNTVGLMNRQLVRAALGGIAGATVFSIGATAAVAVLAYRSVPAEARRASFGFVGVSTDFLAVTAAIGFALGLGLRVFRSRRA